MMNRRTRIIARWLLILLTHLSSSTYAMGQPKYFFHSFSFNVGADAKVYGHPDIDVLDYEYGSSGQFATRPNMQSWEILAQQGIDYFGQTGITGMMPRGEYLYVKWRVRATGEVHEDRVDLTKRLPADMTNQGLYFAVYGTQLYVFLFPPEKFYGVNNEASWTVGHPPVGNRGETLLDISYARAHQIYPDIQK